MSTFDFTTITPVERIALADALYDSAMQEIDAMVPQLTAEQLDDLDRRIGEVAAGRIDLIPWDELHARTADPAMSRRRVLLHPDAAAEVRWYDDRAPRLGQLVLTEVRPGVRRAAVGRLPYLLIYSATDDAVTLLALAHIGRDPQCIERRLAERDQS